MKEIDWNTELKKIEREYDGLPPVPSPAEQRAKRESERTAERRRLELHTALGASVRLLLVLVLGIAIVFWPFARQCGSGLIAYLGAAAVIVLGGLWSAAWTWRARIAPAHALAVAVAIWGAVLAGREVLPRVGYARPDPLHPETLWCAGANPAALYQRARSR